MGSRRETRTKKGTSAVELAVVMPLILSMLLGLWEMGRLGQVKQLMTSAAREGGRQASTSQLSNTQIQAVVIDYLKGVGLPTANAIVMVKNLTHPSFDAKNAEQLDHLEVSLTIPFADVRLTSATLLSNKSTILSVKATWFSMKDKEYPDPSDPPIE